MATEQEQLDPQANEQASIGEVSTDFPKVNTPDQSNIPHHPAADPTAQNPYREETADES
ncbi:MAG TPA: hypothetical protein VET24_15980 [Actinomycetota bacterium]|nr:hypothetical protein [Actinomycetota bacterium]